MFELIVIFIVVILGIVYDMEFISEIVIIVFFVIRIKSHLNRWKSFIVEKRIDCEVVSKEN